MVLIEFGLDLPIQEIAEATEGGRGGLRPNHHKKVRHRTVNPDCTIIQTSWSVPPHRAAAWNQQDAGGVQFSSSPMFREQAAAGIFTASIMSQYRHVSISRSDKA
jgi:hypothetical protein